jgi:hypothetical protein
VEITPHRTATAAARRTGARTVDLTHNVRHAGLVAHERRQVRRLGLVVLGERSNLASVLFRALARREAERAVAGRCDNAATRQQHSATATPPHSQGGRGRGCGNSHKTTMQVQRGARRRAAASCGRTYPRTCDATLCGQHAVSKDRFTAERRPLTQAQRRTVRNGRHVMPGVLALRSLRAACA